MIACDPPYHRRDCCGCEVGFDDALFDAELILERQGGVGFTMVEIGILLGSPSEEAARQRTVRLLRVGKLGPAELPGGLPNDPDRWSKAQVAAVLAERNRRKARR